MCERICIKPTCQMPKTSFCNCSTASCHFKKYRFQMDAHVACCTYTHPHIHTKYECAQQKYTNSDFVRKSVFRPKNISLSLTESQFEWKDLCDLMPTIVPPTEVMFFFFLYFLYASNELICK